MVTIIIPQRRVTSSQRGGTVEDGQVAVAQSHTVHLAEGYAAEVVSLFPSVRPLAHFVRQPGTATNSQTLQTLPNPFLALRHNW
jgi:hypothetical protein